VFDATRPLEPFSIVQESDLVYDSGSLSLLFDQILINVETQLVYRDFAMQMIRTGTPFTFSSISSGLHQKSGTPQNIPLIQDRGMLPKLVISIDDIAKNDNIKSLLGNVYVYLTNLGNGLYNVGVKMRINHQRLPDFENNAFGMLFYMKTTKLF
jgi:hypothetical protein